MLAMDALRDLGRVALRIADPRGAGLRTEEYEAGQLHVIRAELPGRDPGEIQVMVADNEVTIEVRPKVRVPRAVHSEFALSPRRRTIMLPRGAKDDTLTATYDEAGILELTVQLQPPAPIGRCVPVRVGLPHHNGHLDGGHQSGGQPPKRQHSATPHGEIPH